MQTSRRTFLRVLGSALVGAVVAPALSTRPPITQAVFEHAYHAAADPGEPVTYEALERAYHEALDSGPPPGLMECRQTLARETGLIYDVELAA